MLSLTALVLLGAACFSSANAAKQSRRQISPSTLPSYESYINATKNDRSAVTLKINTQDTAARNKTAPLLYGLMHEDISHSGDGGIYAEMIANRAFQGSTAQIGGIPGYSGSLVNVTGSENPIVPFDPVSTAWAPIGDGVRMTLDILHPLSDALTTSLQIDIPLNATGEVGFQNFGWWGFEVSPMVYNTSFYALGNYPRNMNNATTFTASFRSNTTGQVFASSTVNGGVVPYINFQQYNTTLQPNITAPDSNNTFAITMDGASVAGHTYYFNLVSVFPETFKGYQNGLRNDIASAFYDIDAKFLRFPGGNNLEGYSPAQRWDWKKTLGPLINRPGRVGDWSYFNTQGLGLLEYLEWSEAMDLERVLAVYSGFSLDIWGQNGASYPPDMMQEIVQDALDELEYCMGDVSTTYGAMRAADGHPEPFVINYVELGNEDFFSDSYPYRFEALYNGLKAVYPNITYISTAFDENANYTIKIPAGNIWDWHTYNEPSWFLENFNLWDNWQEETNNTGVQVFLGEYSAIQIDNPSGVVNYSFPADEHIMYPRLLSVISEAVYLLSAERNPNTVVMSSYAPSLENFNFVNWTPDMIGFDALYSNTVRSASYWLQHLFAHYRGTHTLPVTGEINPLFWVATVDDSTDAIYLKVINTLNASVPLHVELGQTFKTVNGTSIQAPDLNDYNFINNQTEVVPLPLQLSGATSLGSQGKFGWDVPKFSVSVLQFNCR